MRASAALQSWSVYNRSDPTKGMINDVSDSTMPLRDSCLMKLETQCLMRLESIKQYYFPSFLFCSFTCVGVFPTVPSFHGRHKNMMIEVFQADRNQKPCWFRVTSLWEHGGPMWKYKRLRAPHGSRAGFYRSTTAAVRWAPVGLTKVRHVFVFGGMESVN